MGAVKSYGGLVACRLLLGACEGGMFGGIILYLSMFYKRHNLMFRLGVFYCAAPLSGAFGGLLATGLAQINYHGYNGWYVSEWFKALHVRAPRNGVKIEVLLTIACFH